MIAALLAWLLTGGGAPDLALSQAWIESGGDVMKVSRAKGGLYCGIWQTQASSEAQCVAMRNPIVAAKAYRHELREWLRTTRGDLRRALRGYGCGWKASLPGGRCRSYDATCIWLAKRIARARMARPGPLS